MEINILNPKIEEYLHDVIPGRDRVLSSMEEYAAQNQFPIVGPLVGRLLYVLTKSTQAKRIFELGSGFGYSAFWFAKAMGPDGIVICTDRSTANAEKANEYFKKGKIANRLQFHIGEALEIITTIDGEFDIIFNDINKELYPEVFKKAVPKLRKGGLLISDNAFWKGKILEEKPDLETAGVLTFTRLLYGAENLFTTIIPIKDGILVSVKL